MLAVEAPHLSPRAVVQGPERHVEYLLRLVCSVPHITTWECAVSHKMDFLKLRCGLWQHPPLPSSVSLTENVFWSLGRREYLRKPM